MRAVPEIARRSKRKRSPKQREEKARFSNWNSDLGKCECKSKRKLKPPAVVRLGTSAFPCGKTSSLGLTASEMQTDTRGGSPSKRTPETQPTADENARSAGARAMRIEISGSMTGEAQSESAMYNQSREAHNTVGTRGNAAISFFVIRLPREVWQ